MGEIIIDGQAEAKLKDELYMLIALGALKAMSDMLVQMEASAMNEKEMMHLCVWKILEESRVLFEKVASGEISNKNQISGSVISFQNLFK